MYVICREVNHGVKVSHPQFWWFLIWITDGHTAPVFHFSTIHTHQPLKHTHTHRSHSFQRKFGCNFTSNSFWQTRNILSYFQEKCVKNQSHGHALKHFNIPIHAIITLSFHNLMGLIKHFSRDCLVLKKHQTGMFQLRHQCLDANTVQIYRYHSISCIFIIFCIFLLPALHGNDDKY